MEVIGEQPVTVHDLVEQRLKEPNAPLREVLPDELAEALSRSAETPSPSEARELGFRQRLAHALSRHNERVFVAEVAEAERRARLQLRLEQAGKDTHRDAPMWRVRKIGELPEEPAREVPNDCTTWPSGDCPKCNAKLPRRPISSNSPT